MKDEEIYQYLEMTPLKGGEPVFRGTTIRVSHIIDDFANGLKEDEVLEQHPQLSERHIQAAFVFCRVALKENDLSRVLLAFSLIT